MERNGERCREERSRKLEVAGVGAWSENLAATPHWLHLNIWVAHKLTKGGQ